MKNRQHLRRNVVDSKPLRSKPKALWTVQRRIRGGVKYADARLERVTASRQYKDGHFHNTTPIVPKLKGNPLSILGEYFFGGEGRTPTLPLPLSDPTLLGSSTRNGVFATWLGHSTVLLEMDGARVIAHARAVRPEPRIPSNGSATRVGDRERVAR